MCSQRWLSPHTQDAQAKKTPGLGPRVGNLSTLPPPGPAQGGKAGGSKLPEVNLSNIKTDNKSEFVIYATIDVYDTNRMG
jgi:hypothetical protein